MNELILLPAPQLPAAISDIERQLAIPSDRRDVERFVLAVSVAYAPKRPAALQDPKTAKAFAAAMMEEVARLVCPRAILEETEIRARTAWDWYPSIKGVCDLCSAVLVERRKLLIRLKERLREDEGYERGRRVREENRQKAVKDAQAAWGDDLTADEILAGYDAIERIHGEYGLDAWNTAMGKGKSWALDAIIYMAEEWRAHPHWADLNAQPGYIARVGRSPDTDFDWWRAFHNFRHIKNGEPLERARMVKR